MKRFMHNTDSLEEKGQVSCLLEAVQKFQMAAPLTNHHQMHNRPSMVEAFSLENNRKTGEDFQLVAQIFLTIL
jgi:hypothetical protein